MTEQEFLEEQLLAFAAVWEWKNPKSDKFDFAATSAILMLMGSTCSESADVSCVRVPVALEDWARRVKDRHVKQLLASMTREVTDALPWWNHVQSVAKMLVCGIELLCAERGWDPSLSFHEFDELVAAVEAFDKAASVHWRRVDQAHEHLI